MRAVRLIATALTVVSGVGVVAAGQAAPAQSPPAAQSAPIVAPAEPDPAAVQKVIAAVDAAVAALAPTATAQDIEAAVTYTVDQQQQPANVAEAALRFILSRKALPAKERTAINAVLARLRRGLSGTGGIETGSGAILANGPSVGGGGTGANYTPQN